MRQNVRSHALALAVAVMAGGGCSKPEREPVAQGSARYTISGTARASGATAVDGDTADTAAPAVQNDVWTSAQLLPSAVTVGGWASSTADPDDFYRVTLAAGQAISLVIADGPPADLDLRLYSAPDDLEAESAGTGPVESVTVPESGAYYVRVQAVSGESTYLLTIGQAAPAATEAGALDASHEFVPGEVIVRFKEEPAAAARAGGLQDRAAALGLVGRAGGARREMLMEMGGGEGRARAFAALGIADPGALDAPAADVLEQERRDTVRLVKALRRRPDVASADLNYVRRAARTPNDTYYGHQWHYPLLKLPQAWDVTTGAPASGEVVVAVVDTGILPGHPDLAGKLFRVPQQPDGALQGYDFIRSATSARDGGGIDADPTDLGDSATRGASMFHGSHVAGTIGASSDDGAGVAGVSWHARIMPLRVLGLGGSGTSYDIQQAVRYAAGLANDSGQVPARIADVVNLSLGGPGSSASEQSLYTQVRSLGVVVVAAAGNESSSAPFYPASYDGVISVSAVDMALAKAPYSNFGPRVDVAAPGGNTGADRDGSGYVDGVLSTSGDDSTGTVRPVYTFLQGTSMAAPHVAGVVALMRAICPAISPAEVDALIDGTSAQGRVTTDLGTPGRDDVFGHGLLDALAAVQKARSGCGGETPPPATTLDVFPGRLDFGLSSGPVVVSVAKSGPGELGAVTVDPAPGWLVVAPAAVDAAGLGTYTVALSRGDLADGVYTSSITFRAGPASVAVPVTMRVGPPTGSGDVGHLYLLLLDENLDGVLLVDRNATSGTYPYAFPNVPAGRYYVVAGTDLDGDDVICDAGESCGAYPTLGQPQLVDAAQASGLDFVVGFDVSLTAASAGAIPPGGLRLPAAPELRELRR